MIKLENLPELSDRALEGLKADDSLKARILNAAIRDEEPYMKRSIRRLVPILISSVAVMILCVLLLNGKKTLLSEEQHLIHSFTAGSSETSPISFESFTEIDLSSVEFIKLSSGNKIEREHLEQLLNALKHNSVNASDEKITSNDYLNVYNSAGLWFSIPVKPPYFGWTDGIRRCDSFFELLENTSD